MVRIQQVKPLFPFQTFTIPANETFFVFDADDICGGAEFSVNVKSVNLAGESEAATSSLQAGADDCTRPTLCKCLITLQKLPFEKLKQINNQLITF